MKNRPWTYLLAVALMGWCLMCSGCGGASHSSISAPLVGLWGARDTDAALQLTPLDGHLRVLGACGWGGPLDSPVIVDGNGHFDVTGTYTSNIPPERVHYVGTVRGDTITLTVLNATNQMRALYTLIHNHQPPAFTGGCPG